MAFLYRYRGRPVRPLTLVEREPGAGEWLQPPRVRRIEVTPGDGPEIQIKVYGLFSDFMNLARGYFAKGCLGVPPAAPT